MPPDEVFRRAERVRRRTANSSATANHRRASLLVVAAGLSRYLFREELKRNEALLGATAQTATEIVNTAVAQAPEYRTCRAPLLGDASVPRPCSTTWPASPRRRLSCNSRRRGLIEFARNYEILRDTTSTPGADEAHRMMERSRPSNWTMPKCSVHSRFAMTSAE